MICVCARLWLLSIGVLHIMWSKLADLPFLSIPVASDAFASLELLSLVGDVPICIVQVRAKQGKENRDYVCCICWAAACSF